MADFEETQIWYLKDRVRGDRASLELGCHPNTADLLYDILDLVENLRQRIAELEAHKRLT